ncbi:LysR substrate-binding domain-containing protein [Aestuariimicrobium soli]|uniref:LysR substrate-binding domain-containing protein n=1 Tax=Aestuariimicrobium soli TaxID=2035834 RepID=UPI003EBD19A0
MTSEPTASPRGPLRIGFVPGVTLTKWRRIWDERFRTPLEIIDLTEPDQRRAVVTGEVDLAFVRLPIDRAGLHLIPLYDEDPVVWLSKDHLLAELHELTADDLADERVIHDAEPASIELATYSAAVLRVPLSVARTGSRKDLVHRPFVGGEPTTIGLAWLTSSDAPLVEEFIGVVRGRTAQSSRSQAERESRQPAKAPAQTPKRPAHKGQSGAKGQASPNGQAGRGRNVRRGAGRRGR